MLITLKRLFLWGDSRMKGFPSSVGPPKVMTLLPWLFIFLAEENWLMHKYTILQVFHRQGTWNQFRLQNYIKILPFSSFCWIRSSALDGWKSPILSYKVSWLFIPKFDVHSKHQIQVLFYCKSNRTLTFFLTKLLWVELSWGGRGNRKFCTNTS